VPVTVFDAAAADSVAELEVPREGAWAFYDQDAIAVLDDEEDLTVIDIE
jgi:hypothetical protein